MRPTSVMPRKKRQTLQEEKACWSRFGGEMRPTILRPRKEGEPVGRGSGVRCVQQVSDPVRRESLLVAVRGRDADNMRLAPQGGRACWSRFGGGVRPTILRPRKEGEPAGRGSGVGCVQQVSDPVRRESLLVAVRGWDAFNKFQAPRVAGKAYWRRKVYRKFIKIFEPNSE